MGIHMPAKENRDLIKHLQKILSVTAFVPYRCCRETRSFDGAVLLCDHSAMQTEFTKLFFKSSTCIEKYDILIECHVERKSKRRVDIAIYHKKSGELAYIVEIHTSRLGYSQSKYADFGVTIFHIHNMTEVENTILILETPPKQRNKKITRMMCDGDICSIFAD